jgi:hypothetical protein
MVEQRFEHHASGVEKRIKMEQVLMSAKGITGQIDLYEDRVKIRRRTGVYAVITQGFRPDKNIPLNEISSVGLKKAGTLNGYFEIVIEGRAPKQGLMEAALDPYIITFKVRHQPAFEKIKAAIEGKIAGLKTGETSPPGTDNTRA